MIGILELQTALISKLQALDPITNIPSDVAGYRYQGAQYVYPCVRVRVGPVTPRQRAGACQPITAAFEVIAFSEDESPLEVMTIAKDVVNSLNNVRLTVGSNKGNPIRIIQVVDPIPLSEQRGWAEHILMEIEVPSS